MREYVCPSRRPHPQMTDRACPPRITIMVGVLAVVAAACTSTGTAPSGVAGSPTTASASPARASSATAEPLPEVLDFSAPQLGGGTVDGARYAGKDLAIWFWAPW